MVHQSLVVGLEAAHDIKRREFSDHLVLAVRNQQDALFAFSGQIFLLSLFQSHDCSGKCGRVRNPGKFGDGDRKILYKRFHVCRSLMVGPELQTAPAGAVPA